MVTKEQLLGGSTLARMTINVDGIGELTLRELNGEDRDNFETRCAQATSKNDFRGLKAWVVAHSIIDPETGEKMLSDDDVDTFARGISGWTMEILFRAVQELSKLEEGHVEELAGN